MTCVICTTILATNISDNLTAEWKSFCLIFTKPSVVIREAIPTFEEDDEDEEDEPEDTRILEPALEPTPEPDPVNRPTRFERIKNS
jgi:hypothetical protein